MLRQNYSCKWKIIKKCTTRKKVHFFFRLSHDTLFFIVRVRQGYLLCSKRYMRDRFFFVCSLFAILQENIKSLKRKEHEFNTLLPGFVFFFLLLSSALIWAGNNAA